MNALAQSLLRSSVVALLAVVVLISPAARAQDYPARPPEPAGQLRVSQVGAQRPGRFRDVAGAEPLAGLQVDHDEGDIPQRRTQVVERALREGHHCTLSEHTFDGQGAVRSRAVIRYRCTACGNLTRFDVTVSRRTRAFHHYTVGGELAVEEEHVLSEAVDEVACRWCGHGEGACSTQARVGMSQREPPEKFAAHPSTH